jgi:hypothetical protein
MEKIDLNFIFAEPPNKVNNHVKLKILSTQLSIVIDVLNIKLLQFILQFYQYFFFNLYSIGFSWRIAVCLCSLTSVIREVKANEEKQRITRTCQNP